MALGRPLQLPLGRRFRSLKLWFGNDANGPKPPRPAPPRPAPLQPSNPQTLLLFIYGEKERVLAQTTRFHTADNAHRTLCRPTGLPPHPFRGCPPMT